MPIKCWDNWAGRFQWKHVQGRGDSEEFSLLGNLRNVGDSLATTVCGWGFSQSYLELAFLEDSRWHVNYTSQNGSHCVWHPVICHKTKWVASNKINDCLFLATWELEDKTYLLNNSKVSLPSFFPSFLLSLTFCPHFPFPNLSFLLFFFFFNINS